MDLDYLKEAFKATRDWFRLDKPHFLRVCDGDIQGVLNLAHKHGFCVIESDYQSTGETLVCFVPVDLLVRYYRNYYLYRPYMLTPEAPHLRSSNNSAAGIRLFRYRYYDSKCGNGRKFWEHDLYNPDCDHEKEDKRELHFTFIEASITEEFIEALLIKKWGEAGSFAERVKMRRLEADFQQRVNSAISRSKASIAFRLGPRVDDAEDDAGDPLPKGVAEGAPLTVEGPIIGGVVAAGGDLRQIVNGAWAGWTADGAIHRAQNRGGRGVGGVGGGGTTVAQGPTIEDVRELYMALAGAVGNNAAVAYTATAAPTGVDAAVAVDHDDPRLIYRNAAEREAALAAEREAALAAERVSLGRVRRDYLNILEWRDDIVRAVSNDRLSRVRAKQIVHAELGAHPAAYVQNVWDSIELRLELEQEAQRRPN